MKKGIILGILLLFAAFAISAEPEMTKPKAEDPVPESICPATKIKDNNKCMDCHVLASKNGKTVFGIKEQDWHKQFNYPCYSFKFAEEGGQRVAHLLLSDINSELISKTFDYLSWHPEVKKLVLELHNPGGSMFGMWRIVGMMEAWKNKGNVIETQCNGFSASASFIVFVNGSKGHRKVAPESLHMWHEAMSFSMFDLKTASSTEEEAKIMRKFQDTAHNWLAVRSKMSKEELDKMVSKREMWLTGTEMVKYGFADGFTK